MSLFEKKLKMKAAIADILAYITTFLLSTIHNVLDSSIWYIFIPNIPDKYINENLWRYKYNKLFGSKEPFSYYQKHPTHFGVGCLIYFLLIAIIIFIAGILYLALT